MLKGKMPTARRIRKWFPIAFLVLLQLCVAGFLQAQITVSSTPSTLPVGAVNSLYAGVAGAAFSASGGTGPYTFSLTSGNLGGLTLDPDGTLSGTPTSATSGQITITATDFTNATGDGIFTLTINAAITVTATLPAGAVNSAYPGATFQATGGSGGYTSWTPVSGLPAGMSLNPSTGALSGTPTAASSSSIVVTVTDSAGNVSKQQIFPLTINTAITITGTLPPGAVNSVYPGATFQATGGSGGYTSWTPVPASTLPAGMSLNPGTGALSGTPTAASSSSIVVTVTDSAGNVSKQQSFPITINAAIAITSNPSPLPAGAINSVYPGATFQATGGSGGYTAWAVVSGPGGLNLNPGTGALSGTPTTAGSKNITVTVTDSAGNVSQQKSFPITINTAIVITSNPSPLPVGTKGTAYPGATFQATGGAGGYTGWTVTPANLPAGLSLNPTTGVLGGTPTAVTSGPINVVVQTTDAAGNNASHSFPLTVNNPAPTISSLSPNSAAVGSSQFTLTVNGANFLNGAAVQWGSSALTTTFVNAGQLTATVPAADIAVAGPVTVTVLNPDSQVTNGVTFTVALPTITGLSPNSATAGGSQFTLTVNGTNYVSGSVVQWNGTSLATSFVTSNQLKATVPAANIASPATATITVQSPGNQVSREQILFPINLPGLSITTASPLPNGQVGVPYSQPFTATGGTPPYTWSWPVNEGTLPPGLSISSSGIISGTPTAANNYSFNVQVKDSSGATFKSAFGLTIDPPPLSISPATLPDGVVGQPYSATLTATGGTPPYVSWTVTAGTLPPGLSLGSTGILTGTLTAGGSYNFTVRVTDSTSPNARTATKSYTVKVNLAPISITTVSLPDGAIGAAYSATFAANGGTGSYSWSLDTGSTLPAGLTLNPAGVLSGTPTAFGTFTFSARVTDTQSNTAARQFTIKIAAGVAIATPSPLPDGTAGAAYSVTFVATGGTPFYTWSVKSGTLPSGLSLASSNGVLRGTPTAAGTSNFTIEVKDSLGSTATKDFQLTINASTLAITNDPTLPAGTTGSPYSVSLATTGGKAPYTWTKTSGSLPPGLSLDGGTGIISGTPNTAGTYEFTIQLTDGNNVSVSKAFSLTVSPPGFQITTGSTLPAATYKQSYPALTLAASGGAAPLTWSVAGGSTLPDGMNLSTGGVLSGTPTVPGTFSFSINVTDSGSRVATKLFSLTVNPPAGPNIDKTLLLPDTSDPAQQPQIQIKLSSGYPLPVSGQLVLSFEPDAVVNADDPAVQFSNGSRTINFTIPANATDAVFAGGQPALQTGTVAGTIVIAIKMQTGGVDLSPVPASFQTRILRAAPTVKSVTVSRTSSGFEVKITGFSTPREVTKATYTFTQASGGNLQTTTLTVDLAAAGTAWFQGDTSKQFGSQFVLTQPFTISGPTTAVNGLSVTLTNSLGTSSAGSASF